MVFNKGCDKLAVTWLEGCVCAYIFFCDWGSLSASITRGEFDLFVGPRAATYYYNCNYTYYVYGTISGCNRMTTDTSVTSSKVYTGFY